MDVILKCFFDVFENSERNSLHERYKRRALVEYFNTLIEGFRMGTAGDAQKVVREAVISILRYHRTSKVNNGGVCLMGKYHNILYVALKISFDWQLKDTATVASILDEIFECEKTFERLFLGALFGVTAPHFVAGWKSDFADQEENFRAVIYFLDVATDASLDFSGVRFIDVPIECCARSTSLKIALQIGAPDKVLILLRFGALPIIGQEECPLEWLLNRLKEFQGHAYPYNLVSCLQLLLRVLPMVQLNVDESGEVNQRDLIMEKFSVLVKDCLVPLSRCGFRPPELKHLCRCVIRERLWLNYQLPNGIKSLPIPDKLVRYVDIMED